MRPGSKTAATRPAEANTESAIPKKYMAIAITLCVCSTNPCTSVVGITRPKMETVASAPATTSIRMMKIRNASSAVEQPAKPQKMRRAKASRNVSWMRATVGMNFEFMRLHLPRSS